MPKHGDSSINAVRFSQDMSIWANNIGVDTNNNSLVQVCNSGCFSKCRGFDVDKRILDMVKAGFIKVAHDDLGVDSKMTNKLSPAGAGGCEINLRHHSG
jgi:hypothetical protein